MYVDDRGNIGYKTSGEIPLREDLQAGTVNGLPPYFIRDGTGGNEWISDPTPAEDQALDYEILPFGEMDGLVNPARGWISNANQDPTGQTFDNDPLNELRPGGGIRYITPARRRQPQRADQRANRAALADGAVSFGEMQSIQADVKLNDAAVLVPHITAALEAAQAPGASPELAALGSDPQIQEAVARLRPGTSPRRPASRRATTKTTLPTRLSHRARRRSTPASRRPSTASGGAGRWR